MSRKVTDTLSPSSQSDHCRFSDVVIPLRYAGEDQTQLLPLVEAIAPAHGKPGRSRYRPKRVRADRGYDSERHRRVLRAKRIAPIIARRNTENGSGLGTTRWVVERTLAWLHQFRKFRVRYEKRHDIHEAFLAIGCIFICYNFLIELY